MFMEAFLLCYLASNNRKIWQFTRFYIKFLLTLLYDQWDIKMLHNKPCNLE